MPLTLPSARPPAHALHPSPIRLMLVDDSVVARSILQRMLEGHPEFEVAALASGVGQALTLLDSTAVDIILLDLEMPGMDGLTGLPHLVERGRGARVLILSSACAEEGERAVRALALGAADTLQKPSANRFGTSFADLLVDRLRRIGRAPLPPLSPAATPTEEAAMAPVVPLRRAVAGAVECIAIGASTGGLPALAAFFRALPAGVQAPIMVTQHLPATFMPFFAAQIRDIAARPTKVAVAGDRLANGTILVAPGDAHLCLIRTPHGVRVQLDTAPAPSGCRPSVDPMFRAMAATFGVAGIGVVLSGMGRDGAIGAGVVADAGGEVLVQDAASSVIWGMPGAVAAGGSAVAVLRPAAIADHIAKRVEKAAAWS